MKNPSSSPAVFLGLLGVVLAPNVVSGQVMLSPVAVVGTDLGTYDAAITPLANMINPSGVTTPFVSGSTDFNTYFAHPGQTFANANFSNNWQSLVSFDPPLTGDVDFDLGAFHQINKIAI